MANSLNNNIINLQPLQNTRITKNRITIPRITTKRTKYSKHPKTLKSTNLKFHNTHNSLLHSKQLGLQKKLLDIHSLEIDHPDIKSIKPIPFDSPITLTRPLKYNKSLKTRKSAYTVASDNVVMKDLKDLKDLKGNLLLKIY